MPSSRSITRSPCCRANVATLESQKASLVLAQANFEQGRKAHRHACHRPGRLRSSAFGALGGRGPGQTGARRRLPVAGLARAAGHPAQRQGLDRRARRSRRDLFQRPPGAGAIDGGGRRTGHRGLVLRPDAEENDRRVHPSRSAREHRSHLREDRPRGARRQTGRGQGPAGPAEPRPGQSQSQLLQRLSRKSTASSAAATSTRATTCKRASR